MSSRCAPIRIYTLPILERRKKWRCRSGTQEFGRVKCKSKASNTTGLSFNENHNRSAVHKDEERSRPERDHSKGGWYGFCVVVWCGLRSGEEIKEKQRGEKIRGTKEKTQVQVSHKGSFWHGVNYPKHNTVSLAADQVPLRIHCYADEGCSEEYVCTHLALVIGNDRVGRWQ